VATELEHGNEREATLMIQEHYDTLHYRELRRIRKAVLAAIKKKEQPRGPAKYGLLNKGFTQEEFELFLRHVSSDQARLIFRLQAYLGLRISEAVSIKTTDLDLQGRKLWVQSAKGSYPALFPLLDTLHPHLHDWVHTGHAGDTWLFPAKHEHNHRGHVSPHWAAKELREARNKAGLTMRYGESLPCGLKAQPRPLYRLSTHSLRHLFITTVHNKLGDLLVTQKLARHRDIRSTLHYTYKSQEQLQEAMISVYR
jgi:integrase/recombinase XerD